MNWGDCRKVEIKERIFDCGRGQLLFAPLGPTHAHSATSPTVFFSPINLHRNISSIDTTAGVLIIIILLILISRFNGSDDPCPVRSHIDFFSPLRVHYLLYLNRPDWHHGTRHTPVGMYWYLLQHEVIPAGTSTSTHCEGILPRPPDHAGVQLENWWMIGFRSVRAPHHLRFFLSSRPGPLGKPACLVSALGNEIR